MRGTITGIYWYSCAGSLSSNNSNQAGLTVALPIVAGWATSRHALRREQIKHTEGEREGKRESGRKEVEG